MWQRISLFIRTHERHLSAFAMIAGFVADNLFFGRIDIAQTQLVFASYAAVCFISIPLLQWIIAKEYDAPLLKSALPIATQFALGGFWSGFVIFYGRSAVLGQSWPFLLFLALVFVGSEYYHSYHSRLVFTSVLYFFALYSYAIFAVPTYMGEIGTIPFILSGVVALGIFALFTNILRFSVRDWLKRMIWHIRLGALLVLVIINVSYFTSVLPPLPLSASDGGVYHAVFRESGVYKAVTEQQSWKTKLGAAPVMHIMANDPLYVYSSVFAPTRLSTSIKHVWQWYDEKNTSWITRSEVTYSIVGGRDGGYRGFSIFYPKVAGAWRVDVETTDGRLIDRIPFTVILTNTQVATEKIALP